MSRELVLKYLVGATKVRHIHKTNIRYFGNTIKLKLNIILIKMVLKHSYLKKQV